MTQRGSGYNNPAFCNQFDNTLYDYEYVPEIDPDSPNLNRKGSYRPSKQVAPWSCEKRRNSPVRQNNSDEFENSDESNRSVVIEECNNRRVTMICEKRGVVREDDGGYAHDISLESNADDEDNERGFVPQQNSARRSRRERSNPVQVNNYQPPGKKMCVSRQPSMNRHRYEELDCDKIQNDFMQRSRPSHRYAEIDDDFESDGVRFLQRKPRAPSPPVLYQRHHPSPQNSPAEYNIQRSPSPVSYDYHMPDSPYNDPFSGHPHTSSPIQSPNVFELSDFSPPRHFECHRQPPIGASSNQVTEPLYPVNNSQKVPSKYLKNCDEANTRSPSKSKQEKRNLLTPKSSPKVVISRMDEGLKRPMVRRNISSSFYNESTSPYRPTTQPASNRNTAVITPILQRKFSEMKNDKMSRLFQSTGNVLKYDNSKIHPFSSLDVAGSQCDRMTRNKSVPNFQQQLSSQKRTPTKLRPDVRVPVSPDHGFHSSPTKSPERFSPINKSRISLLENFKASWSNLGSESLTPSSGCLTLAAVVQLASGMVSCAICFYLLSLLGRRYYLDLGMLSGFVSLVLGALGFRSHRWRWLPHRNYVTGYFALAVFSFLTSASLVMIITVRPMPGDPMMDVTAGAICAISVIIILLALTGLTLSGCCKAPPPDNRVTCA